MKVIKVNEYYVASQGYIVCVHKDRMEAIRQCIKELLKTLDE